jgi:glycolate oxidase FAD binding subunit
MAEAFVSELCERIRARASTGGALRIRGGGTKDFYGGDFRGAAAGEGDVLDMAGWTGIVAYEPRELVLTVRAGTPLAQVEAALAAERQMLPFEPPHFSTGPSPPPNAPVGGATIGGTVASGLSGPRRPYAGAVRDFVLGTRIVNGKGEALAFGGRVIKNVAGYDVSRLMTGALGTLGVVTEISFKVLPLPAAEATLAFALSQADAIDAANRWAGRPLPLSACAWSDGILRVRLSGAPPAVDAAKAKLGGDEDAAGARFWSDLREQRLAFFAGDRPLWRLSVPQTAAPLAPEHPQLFDWGGGVRWLRGPLDPFTVRSTVERVGGHATLFRGGDKSVGVFHPLPAALLKIHRRLKAAFDPAGILNPGRMYDF